MLVLILALLLVWAALMVILWTGSLWFQAYIYSEPAAELYWRAPAAGTALTLFLAVWCVLDYKSPGDYQTLFNFSPTTTQDFDSVQAVIGNQTRTYVRRTNAQGFSEYREPQTGKPLPRHPDAIIVKDKDTGQEDRFEAQRYQEGPNKGKFKVQRGKSLAFTDSQGRTMYEDQIGHLSTFHWGLFIGNVLLNFLYLACWFLCLWLLLRFQWPHALGIAVVFWLVMIIIIVPMVLSRAEAAAREAPTETAKAAPVIAKRDAGI